VRKLISLVGIAAAAMLIIGSAANAEPVNNPACDGTKVDPVLSGTYALPDGFVTIDVRDTDAGPVFDYWTDSPFHTVGSLVVKGGPTYDVYSTNDWAGFGLHAPLNPHSGKWYGLSHLCFQAVDPGPGPGPGGGGGPF
jgi:hypothetical protein